MADYVVPVDDSANLIKKRWKSLHRLFRGADKEAGVARAEEQLRTLPNVRLANLVPPINWQHAGNALADACSVVTADWTDNRQTGALPPADECSPVHFVVCQPCCDHAAIARQWAARHQARILTAPEPARIICADESWLESLPGRDGKAWVLPALERCFLRHANGLDLVRRFLERAVSGELGPGVIACDSWAFAFIQRVWPLPETPVLTVQAFDSSALVDIFVRPGAASDCRHQTRFLSARSGQPLLPDVPQTASQQVKHADDKSAQRLSELRQLAAHCLGNPGLAWHYWREQLRADPDNQIRDRIEEQDDTDSAQQSASQLNNDIVWVAPDVKTPDLPAEADEDFAFVFHALLLHRGLTTDLLALLLPASRARIASQLMRLQTMRLLVRNGSCWQVAPLAYPTVREFLRARGYLIDAF